MELVQVLLVQLKLLPLDPIAVESPQLLLLLAVKLVMETIWKLSVFKMVLDPPLQQELQPPSLESVEFYGMPLLPLTRPPMPQPAPMPLHSKLESILTMMRPLLPAVGAASPLADIDHCENCPTTIVGNSGRGYQ